MAKLSDKVMEEARIALRDGGRMPDGVCIDFDRDPALFACSDQEERVAKGEISLSFDGRTILDLTTGELSEGRAIDRTAPVTLMEMARSTEPNVPATNADNATTDNAPAGGRSRAAVRG